MIKFNLLILIFLKISLIFKTKMIKSFYGNMLRESFSPRAGSAVKESAAKAASMLKEGGMVGRATGQGYGAARKGPNVV